MRQVKYLKKKNYRNVCETSWSIKKNQYNFVQIFRLYRYIESLNFKKYNRIDSEKLYRYAT